MDEAFTLQLRRAVGAALRGWRKPGIPLHELAPEPAPSVLARAEPLKPALAIEALLAGMQALFALPAARAASLLSPALADFRDAVGCTDALLVPANAALEPQLLPLPLPSWCAHLVDAGLLLPLGSPRLEDALVVQDALLLAVRQGDRRGVDCFPLTFAGRAAAAQVRVHLALSPPFAGGRWRGPVRLRAAATREGPPLPLWLGAPADPAAGAPTGVSGLTVTTWTADPAREAASGAAGSESAGSESAARAPALLRGPRWAVLRLLEGTEPQALWDVRALVARRLGAQGAGGSDGTRPVSLRLSVDLGSTTTSVLEEDDAGAGAPGGKLLGAGPVPSGFLLLAGDPRSAHRFGCGELLRAPGGHLPTALCAASPQALAEVLRGQRGPEQLWLPQEGEEPGATVHADRFKSPELLLLSDWLASVEGAPEPRETSRKLLAAYALLLGRTLAAAHAAPLVTAEGGSWVQRWPLLESAEALVTYPRGAFVAGGLESLRDVLDGVGRALCQGLRAAWSRSGHRLIGDLAAARAAREPVVLGRAVAEAFPIEADADFGGLTLQLSVRLPRVAGRPAPAIDGSSATWLLGGERLLDAAACASASASASLATGAGALRDEFRARARLLRKAAGGGGRLPEGSAEAAALRESLLPLLASLLARQLEGTLRRAAPDSAGLRGAGVRLHLFGEGWKLLALDVPEQQREEATMRLLRARLVDAPLLAGAPILLERMNKWRLCAGALLAAGDEAALDELPELQGVDASSGQRWFGLAADASGPAVSPRRDDPWWRELTAGVEGSLLRVDQWFGRGDPFAGGLRGGPLAFAPRRSLLRQWLDLCGPSLVALRVRERLAAAPQAPAVPEVTRPAKSLAP